MVLRESPDSLQRYRIRDGLPISPHQTLTTAQYPPWLLRPFQLAPAPRAAANRSAGNHMSSTQSLGSSIRVFSWIFFFFSFFIYRPECFALFVLQASWFYKSQSRPRLVTLIFLTLFTPCLIACLNSWYIYYTSSCLSSTHTNTTRTLGVCINQ